MRTRRARARNPGKASALARRWLAPPSGRDQKYRPDCRSGDNGEVTWHRGDRRHRSKSVASGLRRRTVGFSCGMQQSQGVDDVLWRVRPETDPHRPALRSPACGMSAMRGEGLRGWGNVSGGGDTWLGRGIRVQAQSVGRDGICGMAGIVDVAAERGDQSQPCWIDWPGCLEVVDERAPAARTNHGLSADRMQPRGQRLPNWARHEVALRQWASRSSSRSNARKRGPICRKTSSPAYPSSAAQLT